jgi:hypothetical protein
MVSGCSPRFSENARCDEKKMIDAKLLILQSLADGVLEYHLLVRDVGGLAIFDALSLRS